MSGHVEVLSNEQLTHRVDAILAAHPRLVEFEVDCCHGHVEDDVRRELGPDAADAWGELYALRWLRGDV